MIKFHCFHCNAKLSMPKKYIGRKGRCPKCKAKNTVPSPLYTLDDEIMTMFSDIKEHEADLLADKEDVLRRNRKTQRELNKSYK